MKIFTSVVSIWYVEDSKIDFKNENTAHGNRLSSIKVPFDPDCRGGFVANRGGSNYYSCIFMANN